MRARLSVRVTRRAANEIGKAATWWAANRAAAPDAVGEEIRRAFELIARRLQRSEIRPSVAIVIDRAMRVEMAAAELQGRCAAPTHFTTIISP